MISPRGSHSVCAGVLALLMDGGQHIGASGLARELCQMMGTKAGALCVSSAS